MSKSIISVIFRFLLVFVMVAGVTGCNYGGGGGGASTQWYVSISGDDNNDCLSVSAPCYHIATAIQRAANGDAIHLAAGSYVENLSMSKSLTLIGAGPDKSIIDGSNGASTFTSALTIDGSNITALSVNLEALAIEHGTAHAGGAIHAFNTWLLLMNVLIYDNVWVSNNLPNQYGAIYFENDSNTKSQKLIIQNSSVEYNQGDGIMIFGKSDLDIENSAIYGNTGIGVGYGGSGTGTIFMATIRNNQNTGLAIYYPDSNMTVRYSTIDGNQGYYGGGISNSGDLTLLQSTISNNTAWYGGGLLNKYRVIADNDTFSGNAVVPGNASYPDNGSGGGIYNYTQPGQVGWFDATNLTIANNSAANKGGGIYTSGTMPSTIQDTLLTQNTGGNCAFSAAPSSVITDMSTDNTCPGFSVITDAKIGPLANNGGSTLTYALYPDSPAIDAATGDGGAPLTDQRDVARPKDGNGDGVAKNDIGAYEFDPSSPPPAPASVSGVVWNDLCPLAPDTSPIPNPLPAGCIQDPYGIDADGIHQVSEPGMSDVTVAIGPGDCPTGLHTGQATTDVNGVYMISDLIPGQYCIEVDAAMFAGLSSNGHWTLVPSGHEGKTYRSVTLAAGQSLTGQDFSWYEFKGPTPTPTPVPGYFFIPNINVNCHTGPGLIFDTLDVAMKGMSYPIDGRNAENTWFRIMLNPNRGCWVLESTGLASGDLSGLRVLISPSTPTPTEVVDCSTYKDEKSCEAQPICLWRPPALTAAGGCIHK